MHSKYSKVKNKEKAREGKEKEGAALQGGNFKGYHRVK